MKKSMIELLGMTPENYLDIYNNVKIMKFDNGEILPKLFKIINYSQSSLKNYEYWNKLIIEYYNDLYRFYNYKSTSTLTIEEIVLQHMTNNQKYCCSYTETFKNVYLFFTEDDLKKLRTWGLSDVMISQNDFYHYMIVMNLFYLQRVFYSIYEKIKCDILI